MSQPQVQQAKSDYDLWYPQAITVDKTDNPLNIPYDIALKEAGQLASFIEAYWEPKGNRPGLKRVQKRMPKKTAEDIRSLVRAVQEAQAKLLLLVDPIVLDRGERARFLIDELESIIEFALDDDIEEPADAQLANIREAHADEGQRSSLLSQALRDYATLADELRLRLVEADEEFDVNLIDEAKQLADDLVATPPGQKPSAAAVASATAVRNQLLHLLVGKIGLGRKCAAHVFRDHPEIAREATSAYERRRRAAARRAKAAAKQAAKDASNQAKAPAEA